MDDLKNRIEHTFLLPEEVKKQLLAREHTDDSRKEISSFFDRYGPAEEAVLQEVGKELQLLSKTVHAYIEQQESIMEAQKAEENLNLIMA